MSEPRATAPAQALGESDGLFRAVQEASPDGFVLMAAARDAQGQPVDFRYVYANPAALRLMWRTEAELVGRTLLTAYPFKQGTEFFVRYRRVLETGVPEQAEVGFGAAGGERWFRIDVSRVGDGVATRFVDVTAQREAAAERERLEAALRESETRYRMLVEAAPQLVWQNAADGTPVYFNERYREYTGILQAELAASRWREVVHAEDLPGLLARRAQALAAATPYELELRLRRHDGAYRWFHVRVVPVRAAGTVTCWIGVAADVDALRQAEAQQRLLARTAEAARAEAERASRAKSQFLANMSHEIRTPVNAIVGYTDLLEVGVAGPLSEGQAQYLARIKASSAHLLTLINDVLDLARVESGKLRLLREPVGGAAVLREALALAEPLLRVQGLTLLDESGGADGLAAWGDGDRVRQVLVNLLSNAAKFTPTGGRVRVGCRLAEGGPPDGPIPAGGPYLALAVEDTGIGIAAEEQEKVFATFHQVDGELTRRHGGSGLGLAISRALAREMGGELTLASEPGRGSRFTLWLPAATPEPEARPAGEPRPGGAADWVVKHADQVAERWVARLRAEPIVPHVAALSDPQLADHVASYLADLAALLLLLDVPQSDPDAALADATAIHRVIAERHGHQRHRLGWTEAALRREHALLLAELQAALAEQAADAPDHEPTLATLRRFLRRAEEISLAGFHAAARGEPPAEPHGAG